MVIPRLLHQLWIGDKPPPTTLMDTWREKNPGFEYIRWNEDEIAERGIRFRCQSRIDEMEEINGKADIMRWEILYEYGGVFIDADSICVEQIDDVMMRCQAFAGYENEKIVPGLVATGTMGFPPKHPMVKAVIEYIENNPVSQADTGRRAWETCGPRLLTDMIQAGEAPEITIFPSYSFLPIHHTGAEYRGHGKIYAYQEWGSTKNSYESMNSTSLPAQFLPPSDSVSLLCLSYNTNIRYIEECMESIKQSMGSFDIELVWVNDGSDDEHTAELKKALGSFIETSRRIELVYLEHPVNKGLGYSRNAGLLRCSHDKVFLMDSDDIMKQDRFEKQLAFMEETPDCVICGGQVRLFTEKAGNKEYYETTSHPTVTRSFFLEERGVDLWLVNNPTVCMRRSAVLDIGNYNVDILKGCEDLELALRVVLAYGVAHNLPDLLLDYRVHDEQTTQKVGKTGHDIRKEYCTSWIEKLRTSALRDEFKKGVEEVMEGNGIADRKVFDEYGSAYLVTRGLHAPKGCEDEDKAEKLSWKLQKISYVEGEFTELKRARGHIEALRKLRVCPGQLCLVMEEDVVILEPELMEMKVELLTNLPFDVLLLSTIDAAGMSGPVPGTVRVSESVSASCYIARREYVPTLLAKLEYMTDFLEATQQVEKYSVDRAWNSLMEESTFLAFRRPMCFVRHRPQESLTDLRLTRNTRIMPHILGGLGNQLFVLGAAIWLANKWHAEVVMDKNQTEVSSYGKARRSYLDSLFKKIPSDSRKGFRRVAEDSIDSCYPSGDILLTNGYFQDFSRLIPVRERILKMLDLPEVGPPHENAVAVHIRLEDESTPEPFSLSQSELHRIKEAINWYTSRGYEIHVYSNSLSGARELLSDSGHYMTYPDEIEDIAQLSRYRLYLGSHSTFFAWALFMSQHNKTVFIPWAEDIKCKRRERIRKGARKLMKEIPWVNPILDYHDGPWGRFAGACRRQVSLSAQELTFKSLPSVTYALEHVSREQAEEYAKTMDLLFPGFLDQHKEELIEACRRNDKYGGTNTGSITALREGHWVNNVATSYSSWRYILHAALLLQKAQEFSISNIRLLELGGGYGGLCVFVNSLCECFNIEIEEYIIVDLPGVSDLQSKYLTSLGIDATCISSVEDIPSDQDHFLVSCYGFSSFDERERTFYENSKVWTNASHGFLVWNTNELYNPKKDACMFWTQEEPQTGRANKYAWFSPGNSSGVDLVYKDRIIGACQREPPCIKVPESGRWGDTIAGLAWFFPVVQKYNIERISWKGRKYVTGLSGQIPLPEIVLSHMEGRAVNEWLGGRWWWQQKEWWKKLAQQKQDPDLLNVFLNIARSSVSAPLRLPEKRIVVLHFRGGDAWRVHGDGKVRMPSMQCPVFFAMAKLLTDAFQDREIRIVCQDHSNPVVKRICEYLKLPMPRILSRDEDTARISQAQVVLTGGGGFCNSILRISEGKRHFLCQERGCLNYYQCENSTKILAKTIEIPAFSLPKETSREELSKIVLERDIENLGEVRDLLSHILNTGSAFSLGEEAENFATWTCPATTKGP